MPIGALPDYPLWDWTASNGSATDAQVQAAYNAIHNQGYTRDFSRLVWNDMVDLLSRGIAAAGMTWDDQYTTAAEAKISVTGDGMLTAAMFNSVTRNLNRIHPGFLWEWDSTKGPGYTGRLPFVSDEKIYGWYFEELFLVLNIYIALLRGDENYVNFLRCAKDINVPRKSVLLPARADLLAGHHLAPVPVKSRMEAHSSAFARASYLVDVLIRGKADAKHLAAVCGWDLIPVKDNALLHRYGLERVQARSQIPVVSRGYPETRIYRFFQSQYLASCAYRGMTNSKAAKEATGRYLADIAARGRFSALESIQAGKGMHLAPAVYRGIAVPHESDMARGSYLAAAVHRGMAGSFGSVPAAGQYLSPAPKQGRADVMPSVTVGGNYLTEAPVRGLAEPKPMETVHGEAVISTAYRGAADTKDITPVGGASLIGWVARGIAQWGYPLNIFGKKLISVSSSARTDAVRVVRLSSRSLTQVVSQAALSFIRENAGWYDPVRNGTDVYIRSAYPQWQEGSNVHLDSGGLFYDAEQTGSNVYIRSVDSMKEVVVND